jgi:hypothetical protein
MNKAVILISATVFGIAAGYIPFLWGETDLLSGWGILLGTVGGVFGIWIGVLISRRVG